MESLNFLDMLPIYNVLVHLKDIVFMPGIAMGNWNKLYSRIRVQPQYIF